MKKTIFCVSAALLAASLLAAPKGPVYEPVAEGYCSWAGFTSANRIMGRQLCASDLRHKACIVVFADAEDFVKNILDYRGLSTFNPTAASWGEVVETQVLARDKIAVVVLNGKLDMEKYNKARKDNPKELGTANFYIYQNVTGSKVPDHGGKFPFYCVFGPQPGDPLASGAYDAEGRKKAHATMFNKKIFPEDATWRPFYGYVEEPKYMTKFAKALASGKPLDGITLACKKGIAAKDPEKAKECQMLYDALEQTRSDYLYEVQQFAAICPTRAFYEGQILLKNWPKTKKQLQPAMDRIKSLPDMQQLCKMFVQIKTWSSEDFKCKNAGEAKKIETELKKMKVTCDRIIADSKEALAQSAAAWIGGEAENLAPVMASKVATK